MLPFSPHFRECCRFFGDNGLTLKVFFTKAAPFGVLWTLTNYLYLHAIKKINTTDVSVLFCCNKAFVFLLSWIVLRDRFMGVRVSDSLSLSPFFPITLLPFLFPFPPSSRLEQHPGQTAERVQKSLQRGMHPSLQPAQAPRSTQNTPSPPACCLCTFSFRKEVTCSRVWHEGQLLSPCCHGHASLCIPLPSDNSQAVAPDLVVSNCMRISIMLMHGDLCLASSYRQGARQHGRQWGSKPPPRGLLSWWHPKHLLTPLVLHPM